MADNAIPDVYLVATVHENLQVITGSMWIEGESSIGIVDLLSKLEVPSNDLERRRTFVGPAETGWVHTVSFSDTKPNLWSFHAIMPRRYDATGFVPGKGLYANGLWHPHLMQDGTLQSARWHVEIRLPPGVTGVLNGTVDDSILRWSGVTDRLALAVLPQAHISQWEEDNTRYTLVSRGTKQAKRDLALQEATQTPFPGPAADSVTIVETPALRTLARTGPGMVFLSHKAFRVTGPLRVAHRSPVRRAILEATLPITDFTERQFAAWVLNKTEPEPAAKKVLGPFAWIPEIDNLLNDGRLPFYAELFGDGTTTHPVPLDPTGIIATVPPPGVIENRLNQLGDGDSALMVAQHLAAGFSLAQATAHSGIDSNASRSAFRSTPAAELQLRMRNRGFKKQLTLQRSQFVGGSSAIPLEVNGQKSTWLPDPNERTLDVPLSETPERAELDPDRVFIQSYRGDDLWQKDMSTIVSAYLSEVAITSRRVSGGAALTWKRNGPSIWRWQLSASSNEDDLVSSYATAYRSLGPLVDLRERTVLAWFGAGPGWLNPSYYPITGGQGTVSMRGGIRWDTRTDRHFPRSGHRLAVGGTHGWIVPDTAHAGQYSSWSSASQTAMILVPIANGFTSAHQVRTGLAQSPIPHKLLSLGGGSGLLGVDPTAVRGNAVISGKTELRWLPMHHASIPAPLMWVSDLQLTAGLEAGRMWSQTTPKTAVGWRAGIAGMADLFGVRPTMLGLWAGRPFYACDESLMSNTWPQITLMGFQPF